MNTKKPDILVSFCSNGIVHASFAHCLAALCMYSTARGFNLGISSVEGGEMDVVRTLQIRTAKTQAAHASHILMLDTDMMFPPNALQRLLAHGKEIVGTTYCQRRSPRGYVHESLRDGIIRTHLGGGLDEIQSTGFGCILMKMHIFNRIPRPWFAPIYKGVVDDRGEDVRRSEDRSFCDRAREAGFKVWCDFDLSAELRHIGQFAFGPEHTEIYQSMPT